MKTILVAIECCSFDYLQKYKTPNIDSMELGPHPASSFGSTTRAAVSALLGGFLPKCNVEGCKHNQVRWTNPFFLTNMKKKTNLYLGIPNGWVLELLIPFMNAELRKNNLYWHNQHENLVSQMILSNFEQMNYDDYFFYLHVMESHPPFYHPQWKGVKPSQINKRKDLPDPDTRRKMSVEWIDQKIIGRILKYDYEQFVIVSDHPLKHDIPEPEPVFIASDGIRDLW